jgi:O-antigen/teichoic acid export membrane protein
MPAELQIGSRRIRAGLLANGVTQATQLLIRLLEIPLFLAVWGVERYGHWLLLTALPTAFVLTDGGFTRTSRREMALRAGRGDEAGVTETFQTTFAVLILIGTVVLVAAGTFLSFVDVGDLLRIGAANRAGLATAVLLLTAQVFLYFICGLLHGSLTSKGRYASGELFIALSLLLVAMGAIAGAHLAGSLLAAAIGSFAGQTLCLAAMIVFARRADAAPFGFGAATKHELVRLWRPSIASMVFPVGEVLNTQGVRLAVGLMLGPAPLVAFSALRTMCRVALQPVLAIARTLEPEMSMAYGASDLQRANALFVRGSQAGFWMSLVLCLGVGTVGPILFHAWTGGHVELDEYSLLLLLCASLVSVLWGFALTAPCSRNLHVPISIPFLLSYGIGCVVFVSTFSWIMGTTGASMGVLLADVCAASIVVRLMLGVTGMSFRDWILNITTPPAAQIADLLRDVNARWERGLRG